MDLDVVRELELALDVDEAWRVLSEPGELAAWLGDEVDLDVRPGGSGTVRDDGQLRRVRVDEVVDGSRLVFRWWDEGGQASRVVLSLLPTGPTTRLVVRETPLEPGPGLSASASASATARDRALAARVRWEVRLSCLGFLTAFVRV